MKLTSYFLLPALASLHLVTAFTPTKLYSAYGWIAVSHWEQTDNCLITLTKQLYPSVDVEHDPGFKQAQKDIGDANAAVDDDQHHAEKHMGGESFPHGQRVILGLHRSMKDFLRMNDIIGARMSLGESLHSLQDFYAHSNWIELGNTEPHTELGRWHGQAIKVLDSKIPTCRDCGKRNHKFSLCHNCTENMLTPKGSNMLTSGYFAGEDYVKPNDGKCSHGGIADKSTSMKEGGINKDSILCELSPHYELHYDAVAVSEKATMIYLNDVMNDLTPEERDALLGKTSTVVVAAATARGDTGRLPPMKGDQPLQRRHSSGSNAVYLLEPLESFSTGAKSADEGDFHASTKRRHEKRRGEVDHDAISLGMLAALHHVPSGAHFLIHADSPLAGCHDTAVANLAAKRRIRIIFSTSDASQGNIHVAQASGGHIIQHEHADLLTEALTSQDSVTIYTSQKPGTHIVVFPVDPSICYLHFAGHDLHIIRPNRSTSSTTEEKPNPGTWTISFTGPLTITGRSSIRLSEFSLTQKWGRPAHEGFFAVQQQVLSGASYTAVTSFTGSIQNPQFMLTPGADSTDAIYLDMQKSVNVTDYFTNITLPRDTTHESYYFSMTGKYEGYDVLRTWPVPVKSSPVSVKIKGIVLENGDVADCTVQLSSIVSSVYDVSALVNNPSYDIVEGKQTGIRLLEDETKELTVKVKVPKAEKGSASISIVMKGHEAGAGGDVVASRVLPWAEKNHRI